MINGFQDLNFFSMGQNLEDSTSTPYPKPGCQSRLLPPLALRVEGD
jgi:hypothetical protein